MARALEVRPLAGRGGSIRADARLDVRGREVNPTDLQPQLDRTPLVDEQLLLRELQPAFEQDSADEVGAHRMPDRQTARSGQRIDLRLALFAPEPQARDRARRLIELKAQLLAHGESPMITRGGSPLARSKPVQFMVSGLSLSTCCGFLPLQRAVALGALAQSALGAGHD
jgi:hypothetical protein